MAMTFLFFAQSADWMKTRSMDVTLARTMPLIEALENREYFAPLLERRSCLKVAVNRVMADFTTEVHDGDEVAFLPPYSGG